MKVTVFMSAERAKLLQQRVESTTGLDKVNFMVMWGFEELKAGNTESAIKLFQDVLKMVEPMEIPGKAQTVLEMKKLLALAALRLGEQQNCIINHTTASCIIPIATEGQHAKKKAQPSLWKSIRIYCVKVQMTSHRVIFLMSLR
ncbi:MAG: hypothetical protein IPN60_19980 [Saprospiraceae bacterium]|nr:hypothetical protein [Candidatus Opimibacter skivensis]